jgi:4-hydroxybenzoate polyprenyltransferase
LVAGATASDAALAGGAMLLLQFGIGAANDVIDAPRDSSKPGKPIPTGLVSRHAGVTIAVTAFAGGLGIAAAVDPRLATLAVVVIAIGLAYDVAFKGTAWSWLPFAVGIPVLPTFGWLASARPLPAAFGVLVPAAIAAGAALAIGNALTDVERDRATGVSSVATRLGAPRASLVEVLLFAAVALAAVGSTLDRGPVAGAIGIVAAVPVVAAVAVRGRTASARERAWEIQSVATGVLGIAWLVAVAA